MQNSTKNIQSHSKAFGRPPIQRSEFCLFSMVWWVKLCVIFLGITAFTFWNIWDWWDKPNLWSLGEKISSSLQIASEENWACNHTPWSMYIECKVGFMPDVRQDYLAKVLHYGTRESPNLEFKCGNTKTQDLSNSINDFSGWVSGFAFASPVPKIVAQKEADLGTFPHANFGKLLSIPSAHGTLIYKYRERKYSGLLRKKAPCSHKRKKFPS